MRLRPGLCCWMLAATLAAPAASQLAGPASDAAPGDGGGVSGSHFAPASSDVLANQTTNFIQYQPKIAIRPDGQQFVVVWASAAGADVYARVFNGQGAPMTAQIQVDTTFTNGTQDEPTVAMDEAGRFLVAWSDRQGSNGSDMGVFARAFNPTGVPLGPDFQLNVAWLGSQWEPFAAARPGGWVVGWSGTDGGATYMRLLAANGTPQTGEIEVAQFNSKQVDPVPAVARDGSMFFAWIDFNGKAGAGNATSVFGRFFDAVGNPLGNEFQVNTTNPGEQRYARTAADGIGRYLVVWEDRQTDADAIDIHARRYSKLGFPLSAEWEVNTTKSGDQLFPEAAFDWVGNSVIVWQDDSAAGVGNIRAQRYNPQGQALGSEFVVNATTAGDQTEPDVALDWAGESFVFAFTSLGTTLDVYTRRFRFRPLTQLGTAAPGASFGLELDLPGSAGMYRFVLLSLGTAPGLPLPDGRHLALNYDTLFGFMLANPNAGGAFSGCVGPMPGDATSFATFTLPGNPALVGLTLQIAALTLDLGGTGLSNQLRHVTGTLPVTIQ